MPPFFKMQGPWKGNSDFRADQTGVGKSRQRISKVGKMGVSDMGQIIGKTGVGEMGVNQLFNDSF